ncbi:MAG: glycosyltransferase [Nitrospinota bacterium]
MAEEKPPRILRIIARLNVGGPARHVILLTEKFREKGWASELAVGEVDSAEGSMEDLAVARGIEPVKFEKLGRDIHLFDDLPVIWKLYRLMRRFRPDIVHTHTAKAGAVGRAAAFLYRRGHWRGLWEPKSLRVYHTFHGHVLRGYFSGLKNSLFRRIEWALAHASTALITLSASLQEELSELGVARPEKVVVIPLGIELEPFLDMAEGVPGTNPVRGELALSVDTPLVGIVGRLVPIKDHLLFFEAASRLVKEGAGTRSGAAHFLIVGDGEMRPELESRAGSLGIRERCHFIGWRSDLPDIYESLDLVALTSRNEGTPLCIIEGMAAARAIVAMNVGGVGDLTGFSREAASSPPERGFRIGPVGAIVQPQDPAGFARAMAHRQDYPVDSNFTAFIQNLPDSPVFYRHSRVREFCLHPERPTGLPVSGHFPPTVSTGQFSSHRWRMGDPVARSFMDYCEALIEGKRPHFGFFQENARRIPVPRAALAKSAGGGFRA